MAVSKGGMNADETDMSHAESLADGPPSERLPTHIGPYRIEALLGRGGMGEVYRAWDPRLERRVAVKRVLAARARPEARARFWREARVLAALKHPGLVALHDIGEHEGDLYIAMELVEGESLATFRGVRLPEEAAAALVLRLARALATAHAAGVVHRDIKASNVIIEPSGEPRLIDFGLARRGDEDELTAEGTIVGTWSSMAPEQIAGERVGPATDVHALGVLLWSLLAGQGPYARDSRDATAAAILAHALPDLRGRVPNVTNSLADLVDAALRRDPTERPRDASAFSARLEAIVAGAGWASSPALVARALAASRPADHTLAAPVASALSGPDPRRPRPRVAVAVAIVGVVGLAAFALTRSERDVPTATEPQRVEGTTSAGAAALRRLPRKVVKVLPFTGDDGDLGLAAAEAVMRVLAATPDEVVVVSWRELFAELHDPVAIGTADMLVRGHVAPAAGGKRITMEALASGDAQPFGVWVIETPANGVLAGARALTRSLAADLGLPSVSQDTATRDDVVAAAANLVRAERAAHHEYWREFKRELAAAQRADPNAAAVRLASAIFDVQRGERAGPRAELLRLVNDATLTPRERSFAAVALVGLDAHGEQYRRTLERHLTRFPRDLEARIALLQLDFVALGEGTLEVAAAEADRLLTMAPRSPLAASKLVRAYGWLGRPERARARLAAHGLTAAMPELAFVFAEQALYERDFATAISLFEKAREPDGDLAFYPANMLVAAYALAGDFVRAVGLARRLVATRDTFGIDWTYFLLFNALVGSGDLVEAERVLAAWPDGERGPSPYRSYDRYLQTLVRPDPDALVTELLSLEVVPGADTNLSFMVLRLSHDPDVVSARIAELRDLYSHRSAEGIETAVSGYRLIEGLEARRAFLDGDISDALSRLDALAHGTEWKVTREGELFERARWMAAWAALHDEAGLRTDGEAAWREVLALGYERLLAMDVTYEARRRLGR